MKKFYSFLAAGLLLTACSSEKFAGPENGTEQEVAISVQLPETINKRAAGTNSALGGASNCTGEVTFTAALYYNGTEIWRDNKAAAIPNANAAVTFKPTLVIGENYQLVAYAQMDGVINDLTAQTEANAINDETVDAYYVSTTLKAEPTMSATLKRATAKLRIIAEDFAAAEKQLNKKVAKVAVTYRQAQATELNPTTGVWAAGTEKAFGPAELVAYSNEADAKTILVDYIPATAEGEIINIESVVVTFDDNTTYTKDLSKLDVPVKRNWLTTLTGNFFMAETELKVEIDDAFEGENNMNYGILTAFEFGGEYTLENDVTLDGTLVLTEGKSLVLDLNGKTITNAVENATTDVIVVEEGATLTINGDGNITAVSGNDGYAIISNGTVIINGGNYTSGKDENNEFNAVIYARGNGKVYVNGGTFQNEGGAGSFILNKKDADRATTEIVVKGGSFANFNPANNAAEGPNTNFVAPGYVVEQNGDIYTVSAPKATDAAGVNAAIAAGADKVIVTGEVTLTEKIDVPAGKNATIELAEGAIMTITDVVNAPLVNNGTLTVKGGTIKSTTEEAGRRCIYNYGKMIIDGVKFEQYCATKGAAINNEGKMTIKDATVDAVYYSIWNSGANAEMTIDGGTYTTTNDTNVLWSYCVNCINGAKLTINNGTFTGNHGVVAATSGAEVILNGGTYHCTATYTGNSDWALYANDGKITYDAANCNITNANPAGISITENGGVITTK